MIMDKKYLGSIYALVSASGFGVVPILALFAYRGGMEVSTLMFLRFTIASFLLFIYIFIKIKNTNITPKQIFFLFILGGFFYAMFSMTYFSAIRYIPASMAVLIFYTYPIIVALISYFQGKRITREIIISILVSFIGLVLVMGTSTNSINIVGIILAFAAAIFYASYTILGDHLLKNIPLIVTIAFVCLFSASIFLLTGLFSQTLKFNFQLEAWSSAFGVAIISMLGFLTFFQAIKLTNPTSVSILSMVEPIVTILFSVLLFNDKLSFTQGIGAFFVLTGALITVLKVGKTARNKDSGEDTGYV